MGTIVTEPSLAVTMAFDLGELAISLNLNSTSFNRDLDNAEKRVERFGRRRISLLLDVDDSGIRALDNFQNNVVKTQRWLNRNPLTVRADHTELTGLNEHIEEKRTHAKDVQADLNRNPLTVKTKTEESGASASSGSASKVKQSLELQFPQIESQLKEILNQLKNKSKSPSGLSQGIGLAAGSGLSKLLGNKVKSEIEPLIGSFSLLDKRVTETIKQKISSELGSLPEGVKEPLELLQTNLQQKITEFLGEFDLAVETKSKLQQQQQKSDKKYDRAREGARVEVQGLAQDRFDLLGDRGNLSKERSGIDKRIQAITQIISETPNLSAEDLKLYSAKLEEFEKRSRELDTEIKAKNKQLEANAKKLKQARSASQTLQPEEIAKSYLDLIREMNSGNLPQNANIPKLAVNEELLKAKGGRAAYISESNTIVVDAELERAIKKGKLTAKHINLMLHEIQHAIDFNFGSLQGLDAQGRGEILSNPLTPTTQEMEDLIPFLAQYRPEDRPAELNAELAARRATPKVNERLQRQQLTNNLFDAVGYGGTDFNSQIEANVTKLKSVLKQSKLIEQKANEVGITYKGIVGNVKSTVEKLESQFKPLAQTLVEVATGQVDSSQIVAAQQQVAKQIKSMRVLLSTFDEFKATAIGEIKQVKETRGIRPSALPRAMSDAQRASHRKAEGLVGKPLPSTAEKIGSQIVKSGSELVKPENRERINTGLQKTGQVALDASKAVADAKTKVEQITGSNAKAIAAGENLANNLVKLGGQVKLFSEALAIQKQKAANLRNQLPSAREIKALPPTERVQKAQTMARIAAQGIADQKALISSIPKEQRTQGGEIGSARSLLGEFTKQFNKAKRVLAREKIDVDDVVNMKNITAQVEVMTSKVDRNWEKTTDSIAGNLQRLEITADKIGYEIQKDVSEGSPGITQKIRGHWDKTTKYVGSKIKDLAQTAKAEGNKILGDTTGKISERMGLGRFANARENIRAIGMGASNFNIKFDRVEGEGADEINKLLERIERRTNETSYKASRSFKRATKEIDAEIKSTSEQINQFDINKMLDSNSFGRQIKSAFEAVKKFGVETALKFGALGAAGVLAFKGISTAISATTRAIGDLFFNTQRNIEAFKNLYSLQLKFKAAGLNRSAGFDLAQKQGVSLQAVQGQAGITASLRSQLGVKKSQEIAAKLSEGLVGQGLQGEDLTGSLTAFAQIGSKGKFQAEESMQLRERLPNIAQLSQSALGVTASQMEDMQRSGRILAVEYLPAIADELARAGSNAELPTAELQRAANNVEKLRAGLGEGTLNSTRPVLQMFNAIAKQGTAIEGVLKGLAAGFVGMSVVGLASLTKLALGFSMTLNYAIKQATASLIKFSLTTLPALAGIAAGLALIGTTWTAINKKSEATKSLEEMAASAKKLADSLERAGNVEIKAPQGDRFGANMDGNFAQWLFSGDMGSRLVDFMSFGGLTRMKEADESIATSEMIQNSGKVFEQSLKSPEKLQQIVADIQGQKARLAAKKVELIDLTNAKAGRDEIQKVNREIGDISGAISKNKKQINSFIREYENLKAFMETDEFAGLSESNQTNIKTLFDQYGGQIDMFRGLQEQIAQKTKFELEFNLSQASIEAAQMDLQLALAELDIKTSSRSQTSSTNVAIQGQQERLGALRTQLSSDQSAIANQRKELSAIPDDLQASIKALIGTNLEDATAEQINQALTKLENSSETAGEDLKAALISAKSLKQNEIDALNKRKEILALELQIQATQQRRSFADSQISSTMPLAGIRQTAVNEELALASSRISQRMSSTAVSIAQAQIQIKKTAGELGVIGDRLINTKNNLGSFDKATQQWFLNLIGKPTANFAEAVETVSSELLQELKNGYGEEIGASPIRQNLIQELEKFDQLRNQQNQLQLQNAQNRASMVESMSDQLFQSLQTLESEIWNSDNAFRSQARSLQDFIRSIEDYNLSLKDAVFNLGRQIKEVQANIALTQMGTGSAFFSAAGIQNIITDFFSKMGSLAEQANQIDKSDRRPQLERELDRDRRDFNRRNEQFDRQEEDIRASTNSQVFSSQQAIARLERENFTFDTTDATDSETGEIVSTVTKDSLRAIEASIREKIATTNFQASSFNDFAARNKSSYRIDELSFSQVNFDRLADDPEAVMAEIQAINDWQIRVHRQRINLSNQIQKEGLREAKQQRQEAFINFKEQEKQKTKLIEEEGRLQAAKTEKLAKTIEGTYLALDRSLTLGVPSIKLERDRLSMGNQELYSSMFGIEDPQPYLTGRTKAGIQIGERELQLKQQHSSLKVFLDNASQFTNSEELINQINKLEFSDPRLKDEIIGKLNDADTQQQIAEIIAEYRNQLAVINSQLKGLESNKDFLKEQAGDRAREKSRIAKNDRSLRVREQLGGVLKESGKLDLFETARMDRELGTERINLEFREQVEGIRDLKIQYGELSAEYQNAKESLEALRDIKLDNLIEQTDVWKQTLKDSVGSGFDTFIDTLTSDFGNLDKLWRNTLASMLKVFADFAAQIAKQQLMKWISGGIDGAKSGGNATGRLGGLIASGIMAAMHDGGEVKANLTIPNFAPGGLLGAIDDAYGRERAAGNQPVLLVAGVGERILNKKQTAEWDAWKASGVKQEYVPNMALGGKVGDRINSTVRNYSQSSSNNYSSHDTINVNIPRQERRDRLGRSEERQATYISERVRRAKRRNG